MKQLFLFFVYSLLLVHTEVKGEAPVILVTGGAGYIGSHACKALSQAGFYPVTYDSLINGSKEAVKWGPLVVGDLNDTEKLNQTFCKYKPVAVMHFAALRNVGDSITDPSSYYQVNVAGSIQLLTCMLKHNVKTIIFSSSCTVYGSSIHSVISEDQPRAPVNPYATSKFFVEKIIEDFARAYDFKYALLRYFNAAGMDVQAGLKRSENAYNFLIPRALKALIQADEPLPLYGKDYATPDGTCIRDYIHVSDLAEAHLLALQHLQQKKSNLTLNLGTGKGYSVFEIIKMIEQVTNQPLPYVFKPRREGDLAKTVADPTVSKQILHFTPCHSDLQEIIESEWTALRSP